MLFAERQPDSIGNDAFLHNSRTVRAAQKYVHSVRSNEVTHTWLSKLFLKTLRLLRRSSDDRLCADHDERLHFRSTGLTLAIGQLAPTALPKSQEDSFSPRSFWFHGDDFAIFLLKASYDLRKRKSQACEIESTRPHGRDYDYF